MRLMPQNVIIIIPPHTREAPRWQFAWNQENVTSAHAVAAELLPLLILLLLPRMLMPPPLQRRTRHICRGCVL
jgi:hypothetical protein